eukprot:GHVQ01015647.1.p1 GENE.GHVQ01015647.1~~GHVQ01015647.1.p1  ORF type:complete len:155 (+),score=15.49 GHVQ01015647.1:477-941(+)
MRRMNDFNWPPADSSPLIPLEPWGNQLMVFNANQVSTEQWGGPKGCTPRLPPKIGFDKQLVPTETVLCMTDYKRRPKLFLSRADFEALTEYFPDVNKEMKRFDDMLKNKSPSEDRAKLQHDIYGRRGYAVQRSGYNGPHKDYIIKKGSIRYPKT